MGKAPRRLLASAVFALASVLTPLFTVGPPAALGLLAMCSLLAPFRWLDLARDRRTHSGWVRVWLFVSPFDVRRVVPTPRRLDPARVAQVLGFALLFFVALTAVEHVGPPSRAGQWALRWLAGAVVVYAMVDCTAGLVSLGYEAAGLRIPEIHRAPILSTTLAEFWGERWNRSVHGILDQHCFRPLARRRLARAGVVAAFVASAALHAWLIVVSLRDGWWTAGMFAFFVVQGLLVLLERALRVARWRPAAGRIWTAAWMLVTTPLFVEPVLLVFGV